MGKSTFYLFVALVCLCGCNANQSDNSIAFETNKTIEPLAQIADHIELVPLETDSSHILGARTELSLAGKGFLLADNENGNIYLYDDTGNFTAKIGGRGNGPQEYEMIMSTQALSSSIAVFSMPSSVLMYGYDGSFLSKKDYPDLGTKSYIVDNGLLTYFGYGSGRSGRLGFYSGEDDLKTFLPSDEQVINMTPMYQIFSENGGTVSIVDSYSNTVKLFKDGDLSDGPTFDLGKYAIPDDFFSQDDAMKAAELLLSRDFALIDSYQDAGDRQFAAINVQKTPMPEKYYGIGKDGKWTWFSGGTLGEDVFADGCRVLSGNVLYCLLDASLKDTYPNSLKGITKNPEVLEPLDSNSNFVIAKVYLK